MLPRAQRIGAELFSDIIKRGRVFHAPHVSMRVLATHESTLPRFAVSVSKKIDKRATKRNYIRRIVYSLLRQKLSLLQSVEKEGLLCIFFPKQGILDISRDELSREIGFLIEKGR